jgi:dihydroxyacetone kinase-like predicted kinase
MKSRNEKAMAGFQKIAEAKVDTDELARKAELIKDLSVGFAEYKVNISDEAFSKIMNVLFISDKIYFDDSRFYDYVIKCVEDLYIFMVQSLKSGNNPHTRFTEDELDTIEFQRQELFDAFISKRMELFRGLFSPSK